MKKRLIINSVLVLLLFAALVPVVHADDPVNRTERAEVRFLVGMIDHHQMALDMAQDCLMKASNESLLQVCQNIITNQQNEINEMRGWLLIWYGIEYRPMSMMHMMHSMMQGGMMGGGMMGQGGMMGEGMMQGGMMGEGGMMGQGGMMQGTPMQQTPMPGGPGHEGHHPEGQGAGGAMQGTPMPGGMMDGGMMGGGMMGQSGYVQAMPMMGMMAGLHLLTGPEYEAAWLEAMIEHHQDALHMAERILESTERPELVALGERIIEDQTAEIEAMEELIAELTA